MGVLGLGFTSLRCLVLRVYIQGCIRMCREDIAIGGYTGVCGDIWINGDR